MCAGRQDGTKPAERDLFFSVTHPCNPQPLCGNVITQRRLLDTSVYSYQTFSLESFKPCLIENKNLIVSSPFSPCDPVYGTCATRCISSPNGEVDSRNASSATDITIITNAGISQVDYPR